MSEHCGVTGEEEGPPSVGYQILANFAYEAPMPLSKAEAEAAGWEHVDDACDPLYGLRYRLNGRKAPTMLYAPSGAIFGIQMGVDRSVIPSYPDSNMKESPVLAVNGDARVSPRPTNGPALQVHFTLSFSDHRCAKRHASTRRETSPGRTSPTVSLSSRSDSGWTVYLSDPDAACSADHSVPAGSIGDRAWLRLSDENNDAASFDMIPLTEDEMYTRVSKNQAREFYRGGCVPSGLAGPQGMGLHYWQILGGNPGSLGATPSPDSTATCGNSWGPIFYMYTNNKLASLGAQVSSPVGLTPVQPELGEYSATDNPGGNLWNPVGANQIQPTLAVPQFLECWKKTSAPAGQEGFNPNAATVMHLGFQSTTDRSCDTVFSGSGFQPAYVPKYDEDYEAPAFLSNPLMV